MNSKTTQITEFTDKLIAEGESVLSTKWMRQVNYLDPSTAPQYVDLQQFNKWRASCQLLMMKIGECNNPWKEAFDGEIKNNLAIALNMQGKLEAIREAITNGLMQFEDLKVIMENQEKAVTEKKEVFIVHGRDELAETKAARFIEQLGLKAIILHEQASSGKTIIEKIEEHTNVGFAIVLYTPCDVGSLADEILRPRARQNVVFEHGYLIGKLGRQNVCALVKGDIELPNDISGVVYIPLDNHEGWHKKIVKELNNAGYAVDMNNIM